MLSFIYVANGEFSGRAEQSMTFGRQASTDTAEVRLILHRFVLDDSSVEASIVVTALRQGDVGQQASETPCFRVEVFERSPNLIFPPRSLPIRCATPPGYTDVSGESERFSLPIHQGIGLFPFDDIQVWPIINLEEGGALLPARYSVTKEMPGRVMSITGDLDNPEFIFTRSPTEQLLVLAAASLFVGIALFASWKIGRADLPTTGVQDLLAVASFIVAAVEFRSVLGISATGGTDALEIGLFVVTFLALSTGILIGQYRTIRLKVATRASPVPPRLATRQRARPHSNKKARPIN